MTLYLLAFVSYEDYCVFGIFDTEAQARLEGAEIQRRGEELSNEVMLNTRDSVDFSSGEYKIYYVRGFTMEITELTLNTVYLG